MGEGERLRRVETAVVVALAGRIAHAPQRLQEPLLRALRAALLQDGGDCRVLLDSARLSTVRLAGEVAVLPWALPALADGRVEDVATVLLDSAGGEEAGLLWRALAR